MKYTDEVRKTILNMLQMMLLLVHMGREKWTRKDNVEFSDAIYMKILNDKRFRE